MWAGAHDLNHAQHVQEVHMSTREGDAGERRQHVLLAMGATGMAMGMSLVTEYDAR
jgi:hypothetical protein